MPDYVPAPGNALVKRTLKKEGLAATLTKVRTRLETLKELGYSSAGTVLASMDSAGL